MVVLVTVEYVFVFLTNVTKDLVYLGVTVVTVVVLVTVVVDVPSPLSTVTLVSTYELDEVGSTSEVVVALDDDPYVTTSLVVAELSEVEEVIVGSEST